MNAEEVLSLIVRERLVRVMPDGALVAAPNAKDELQHAIRRNVIMEALREKVMEVVPEIEDE